ncbi:UNVERIFIED_CONTAM: hypothetical protein FKN15_068619, partial [Acipenser sinensis]
SVSMSRGRLSPQGTILLLCDLQEKFRPHIVHFGDIVSNAARLLQASRILGVPAIVSEQYPRGLGPTVPELGAQGVPTFSKTSFSMLTPEIEAALGGGGAGGGARSVLLCGIEAQACITVSHENSNSQHASAMALTVRDPGSCSSLFSDSSYCSISVCLH